MFLAEETMLIDIEQFCSRLDDERPAGEDLEYDHEFLALDLAQKGKPERQFGDTVAPAEPPDWKLILQQATTLASRTRDLRIACALTRALTHLHGLPGLVAGLRLMDRLCHDLWDHVFPALDESDGNDPTLRMNSLAPLADRECLLADIRDAAFVSVRGMGSCNVRQLEMALGILAVPPDSGMRVPSLAEIDALVQAAKADGSMAENHAQTAIRLAQKIHRFLADAVGMDRAPDMQPLVARLKPIAEYARKFFDEAQAGMATTSSGENAGMSFNAESVHPAMQAMTTGDACREPPSGFSSVPLHTSHTSSAMSGSPGTSIRSAEDAVRMLDLVCSYFEQHEPTNPAPLLLRRAQKLSTMSFYDIVRDLAPDAISSVDLVAGSRAEG
jgi:type VI secretion system protein ImpA